MNAYNMHTMLRAENSATDAEIAFDRWFAKVVNAAGCDVNESDAWDLFADGCDVEDAVAELACGA
jgi:hypothetical protein